MDHEYEPGRLRFAAARAEPDVSGGWRHSLTRWHKHPAVRKQVRFWLIGLMSFGPVHQTP
jgi:hypothetical protein